jgi:type IV secretion system protein VirD4
MLSSSEISMRKIGKKKTAVFLIIPDENTLYHRLVSVFIKQCYTELILAAHRRPSRTLPRRVNFLLDEFATLPPISDFPAMITASRSRNIRFILIVQGTGQLYDRYGRQAATITGNCENTVLLHSRELGLLNEITELCGQRNNSEPLVSASMLQTLDKDKGEMFVLHKRLYPFIASVPDIDSYPGVPPKGEYAPYPENKSVVRSVFDFENFCRKKSGYFLSQLFSGRSLKEIGKDRKGEEEFYMVSGDPEPIFTSPAH